MLRGSQRNATQAIMTNVRQESQPSLRNYPANLTQRNLAKNLPAFDVTEKAIGSMQI